MKTDKTVRDFASATIKVLTIALCVVGCIGLIFVLVQIFVLVSFSVSTNSMKPTIQPGDRILVFKSTGPRILNVFKAAKGEDVTIKRLPKLRDFRRGDILVFNFLHDKSWSSIDFNWERYYVKRCIAIPGDTMMIKDFIYYVNSQMLRRDFEAEADLHMMYPNDSIACVTRPKGYIVNVNGKHDSWSIRNFGPLIVPRRGMTINLDTFNVQPYRQIIEWESGGIISSLKDKLMLNGIEFDRYTFRNDYYFMAGDNIVNSMDSRYWGLLPELFIVGRASMIWWSENRNGVQWHRLFTKL